MIDRGYIWRTTLVVVALLAVWAGLAVRLGYLHLGANEGLKRRVLQMRTVSSGGSACGWRRAGKR